MGGLHTTTLLVVYSITNLVSLEGIRHCRTQGLWEKTFSQSSFCDQIDLVYEEKKGSMLFG